jgi:hypothetical protein
MSRGTFEPFDVVALSTTKNVKWMSDVIGSLPDPKGRWTVICAFPDRTLLLQKESALIKAPVEDVIKVANYEMMNVFEQLEKINDKIERRIGGIQEGPGHGFEGTEQIKKSDKQRDEG